MMKVAALLMVAIVCVSAYTEDEYRGAFTAWMQKNNKAYATEEFQTRYGIFKNNMDFARDWNAQYPQTVLGMTIFADLTNAEYQKIYLGTHIDGTERLAAANVKPQEKVTPKVQGSNYTAVIDWRAKGAVTAIKNQGDCGSCWSFSTTGSTEGIHFLTTNNLVGLSEQNLMDCSTSYGNAGCNGGLMDNAFKYIIANNGIDTEASYPYQGVQGACKFTASNIGATVTGFTDVTSGSEADLETAANSQPISVAIDASHTSFQLYTSGIYHSIFCSATRLDHGVLVVGYGTYGSENYWIVKNSWGTSWGQQGFIYMSKDRNNNCGIATAASYPAAASA